MVIINTRNYRKSEEIPCESRKKTKRNTWFFGHDNKMLLIVFQTV